MKFFDRFKKEVKKVDDRREAFENKAADLMDKIGKNEAYVKYKNKGADKLVALGIEAGIALAESQTGEDITISQDTIDKVADKGGDGVVKIWDKFMSLIKKQLRK